MRLHAIETRNFMCLSDFSIEGLDAHLNFIVGPNGSGKTAMFRALRTIRDAFTVVSRTDRGGNNQERESFLAGLHLLRTRDATEVELEISACVEFDTQQERESLTTFVAAALAHPGNLKEQRAAAPAAAISARQYRANG